MTKIEWCDETINPIIGCSATPISPACSNCYAARMAFRLGHGGLLPEGPTRDAYKYVIDPKTRYWSGGVAMIPSAFETPTKRRKPTTYFIGSMTDIGHFPEWQDHIYPLTSAIQACPQHTFLILTKRPGMWLAPFAALENVWIGASASDQADLNRVAPDLLRYGGPRTFLSLEPLLGPIDIAGPLYAEGFAGSQQICRLDATQMWLPRLRAVIVGGQTGPGAQPMHPDWARSIRDDCAAAGVPFFFKQWGTFLPKCQMIEGVHYSGEKPEGDGCIKPSGKERLLDGRTHDDLPWPVKGKCEPEIQALINEAENALPPKNQQVCFQPGISTGISHTPEAESPMTR